MVVRGGPEDRVWSAIRRHLTFVLATLVVVLAFVLPAGTASTSSPPAVELRVGAIHPAVSVFVGVAEHIAAGQHRCRAASQLRLVSGHCVAAEASSTELTFAPRVLDQLNDARLGPLQGKLTTADLQQLDNKPGAQYLFDARTGNINVIQEVDGVLLRITSAADEFKIFSVGPIRANQVANLIKRGDFIPIGGGGG